MISNFLKFRTNAWLRSRAIMALPSIYLIEWSRLNGNISKKKGTKKWPEKAFNRHYPKNKSPKPGPKHQNSSSLCVVQTPRRQARGGCAPALAVCLRSLIKAKNNRRHVQQAVSKKNRRYSVHRIPLVIALTALLPPNMVSSRGYNFTF